MENVYFCRKNEFKTKKLYKALQALYPELNIKRKDCLGKCRTCKHSPFSTIDGEVVKCPTVEELFQEVDGRIQETAAGKKKSAS